MQMNEAGAPRFYVMPLDEDDHGAQWSEWFGLVDEESAGIVATAGTAELAEQIRVVLDATSPEGVTFRRWMVTAPCWRCRADVRGERGGEDWEDARGSYACPGDTWARPLFHVPAAELRCSKCSSAITDAETASLPLDGSQLCRDCGDPDGEAAPACEGFPGACGAPAGQPCKAGCPSLATDEHSEAFPAA
jgi:hypothetical protein